MVSFAYQRAHQSSYDFIWPVGTLICCKEVLWWIFGEQTSRILEASPQGLISSLFIYLLVNWSFLYLTYEIEMNEWNLKLALHLHEIKSSQRFWKANSFYTEMQLEMEQKAFYKGWNYSWSCNHFINDW